MLNVESHECVVPSIEHDYQFFAVNNGGQIFMCRWCGSVVIEAEDGLGG